MFSWLRGRPSAPGRRGALPRTRVIRPGHAGASQVPTDAFRRMSHGRSCAAHAVPNAHHVQHTRHPHPPTMRTPARPTSAPQHGRRSDLTSRRGASAARATAPAQLWPDAVARSPSQPAPTRPQPASERASVRSRLLRAGATPWVHVTYTSATHMRPSVLPRSTPAAVSRGRPTHGA